MSEVQERPLARGIKETAAIVGVSPTTIRRVIEAGELKSVRRGRRVLIRDADLLAWINEPISEEDARACAGVASLGDRAA